MHKQEAAITTKINKWFPLVVLKSCPYEVKHTRGAATFKYKELKQHQRDYLLAATTSRGMHWKIPDTGFSQNPFDCFVFNNAPAFVVIVYPEQVYAIEIGLIEFQIEAGNNVLTEDKAATLALYRIAVKDLPR